MTIPKPMPSAEIQHHQKIYAVTHYLPITTEHDLHTELHGNLVSLAIRTRIVETTIMLQMSFCQEDGWIVMKIP